MPIKESLPAPRPRYPSWGQWIREALEATNNPDLLK